MINDNRKFSLSIWNHNDEFICLLKDSNGQHIGQSYNESFEEKINGEKTLSFSIPMYIVNLDTSKNEINDKWQNIYNEQKIRLTFYDTDMKPERIEEFVLKNYTESRDGEKKIADCECESLAAYELGKIGWNIDFSSETPTTWEQGTDSDGNSNCPELLTIDYWMDKIFYENTQLGRVSTTTECTKLLKGIQLRNSDGFAIDDTDFITDEDGRYSYSTIAEPIATDEDLENYKNKTGWHWEIQSEYDEIPERNGNILYENPSAIKYIETSPNTWEAFCTLEKEITTDNVTSITTKLGKYPISTTDKNDGWRYAVSEKKRILSAERSNIFTIIQDMCESFEIWAYFSYEYNSIGKITDRKITFKTEAINSDVDFDFSYGKNLSSCQRTSDSNDLITKLYIPDIDSELVSGNVISIKNSMQNPTGEGYLYNFDYFYQTGVLDSEDKTYMNNHYNSLKKHNETITNIQNLLTPLYDKRTLLESNLSIAESSKLGYVENIQTIQQKIDAIPASDQIIKSWADSEKDYSHPGELKTLSATTVTINSNPYKYYLNFGREDIIDSNGFDYNIVKYDATATTPYIENTETLTVNGFAPRVYSSSTYSTLTASAIEDSATTNFFVLESSTVSPYNSSNPSIYYFDKTSFDEIEGTEAPSFIKGIYFSETALTTANAYLRGNKSIRIRYKYAPLIYYYYLIKVYWNKIQQIEEEIEDINNKLTSIINRIAEHELSLSKELKQKNNEILNFEKKYKPYIREGYWEPSDYDMRYDSISELFADQASSTEKGIYSETCLLSEMTISDEDASISDDSTSTECYKYYFTLSATTDSGTTYYKLDDIDIDSISIYRLENSAISSLNKVPYSKESDYQVYKGFIGNQERVIIAISRDSTDYIEKYNYAFTADKTFDCYATFSLSSGVEIANKHYDWSNVNDDEKPVVVTRRIEINDDNLATNSIVLYGKDGTTEELLSANTDYIYYFESILLDSDGVRHSLNEDLTGLNLTYDYSTIIQLKQTNKTNKYSKFKVQYSSENTLQFLYNDSVQTSNKYSVPIITYDVSVVDLSSLPGYENYKPRVGQKIPIYDPEMRLDNFEGFVSSIQYSLETPYDTKITIATYSSKFEDIFNKLNATVSEVSYNKNDIMRAANVITSSGTISSDAFQKSLEENQYKITMGTNNTVEIDNSSGITLTDNDNNSAVKLIGNGIFLTPDISAENVEWRTGITGEGINADALTAGTIDTKKINIWNASEGQVRFVWNEQGLFSYGDTVGISTEVGSAVDYNKYVKLNKDGLKFNDNGKSALSLGWSGLNIYAQNNALELNADDGLKINKGTTTLLQLGKFSDNTYGLQLNDDSGDTTFKNTNDGNLWLSGKIEAGGSYNTNTGLINNPTAGIYGYTNTTDPSSKHYNEMGILGPTDTENWSTKKIRFWAGPMTGQEYLEARNISLTTLTSTAKANYLSISTEIHPCFSRFKVDEDGNIVASGIDVGGWIGSGNYLYSADSEAILRSGEYNDNEFPVIAVGMSTASKDGKDYKFRVYPNGTVNASALNITGGSINITDNNNTVFSVSTNGSVEASDLNITGGSITIKKNSVTTFMVSNEGAVTASNISITGGSINIKNGNNTAFNVTSTGTVTADNIKFSGTISAKSGDSYYTGVDSANIVIQVSGSNDTTYQNLVVRKGLIVGYN